MLLLPELMTGGVAGRGGREARSGPSAFTTRNIGDEPAVVAGVDHRRMGIVGALAGHIALMFVVQWADRRPGGRAGTDSALAGYDVPVFGRSFISAATPIEKHTIPHACPEWVTHVQWAPKKV